MADQVYPISIAPDDDEIYEAREVMILLGLVRKCDEHVHEPGNEHVTLSRKGLILMMELVDFLADDQLLEIAMKRKEGKSVH